MEYNYENVHVVVPRRITQDVLNVDVLDLMGEFKYSSEEPQAARYKQI